jgi:uncharacterized membrane protein
VRTVPLALVVFVAVSAAPPAATGAVYKMIGTEPFWDLSIDSRTLNFDLAGMPRVVEHAPKPRKTKYGRIYWTKRIQVAIITNQPCSDGMSDYVYRDDVTVTVDGKQFLGCGGPRHLPPGADKP